VSDLVYTIEEVAKRYHWAASAA